jgi:hypothetical protein
LATRGQKQYKGSEEYVSGNENAALVWQKMGFEPVIIIANGHVDKLKNCEKESGDQPYK